MLTWLPLSPITVTVMSSPMFSVFANTSCENEHTATSFEWFVSSSPSTDSFRQELPYRSLSRIYTSVNACVFPFPIGLQNGCGRRLQEWRGVLVLRCRDGEA